MNWEAIGAVGELLGSVGVLFTLIYLALQIRQNTETLEEDRKYVRAQMYQARADAVMRLMTDHGGAMIPLVSNDGLDYDRIRDLTPEQRGALNTFARAMDVHTDNIIRQREIGLLEVSDESLQANETLAILFELSRRLNIKLRPTTKRHMQQHDFDVGLLPG